MPLVSIGSITVACEWSRAEATPFPGPVRGPTMHRMPTVDVATLRLNPGSGRIARRPLALIFTAPGSDGSLISSFLDAATDADAVTAVCESLVEGGFLASPFAVVTWIDQPRLLVFGDLEVTTDVASAPGISGVGSSTWVEHSLPGHQLPVSLALSADDIDPLTRFDAGVAHAGGFSLVLGAPVELAPVDPVAAPPTPSAAPDTKAEAAPPPNPIAATDETLRGELRFESGLRIPLQSGLLIGRRPDPQRAPELTDLEPVTVADRKLSRNHLAVRFDGSNVVISDCGSLNGTVVVAAPGATPRRIEPGNAIPLGNGARIHFGDDIAEIVL